MKNITQNDTSLVVFSLAFQYIWRLTEWSISYPDQWRQKDGVNCGVFLCTVSTFFKRKKNNLSYPFL